MRAVVKASPGRGLDYSESIPDPVPGTGDVVVRVEATSICGSDMELYEWTAMAQAMEPELPVVAGHETAGVVTEVGADVRRVAIGDRVALESHIFCGACGTCRRGDAHNCERLRVLGFNHDGGFADFTCVPESVCVGVPESVPPETAALLEPFGVAVHALQRAGLQRVAGASVLVNGCGPVGLFILNLASALGASVLAGVELNPYRRGLAEKAGAIGIDPGAGGVTARCEELGLRRPGFDLAFEASGIDGMVTPLLQSVRREGTVVTVGHPGRETPIDVARYINKKGVELRGIFGRRVWDTWDLALDLVSGGRIDPSWLVTHRLAFSEVGKAMELLRSGAGKIILHPGGKNSSL
ncbi:MAG: alcohol dehydrogenase catalytic domain-containing protein [Nocardiopsaceae bacterium]|nr:alcohol dehydrogenase catalytic domain-containing protein [Nocardiopsaceae bacterium]